MLWADLHIHITSAGLGFHLPSVAQTAVIFSVGTNLGLHPNTISAPSVVFWYGSMEPFPGKVGSLQLTIWEEGGLIMSK